MSTKNLLGELRYHGETDPWCNAAVAEIERLRTALLPFAMNYRIKSGYDDDDLRMASEAIEKI